MTDKKAIEILFGENIDNITRDLFDEAIVVAANKLIDFQWHDYIPEEFKNDGGRKFGFGYGSEVILGIEFYDGSHTTVNGRLLRNYSTEDGYYFWIDDQYVRQEYDMDRAVIKKYMKYPDYG